MFRVACGGRGGVAGAAIMTSQQVAWEVQAGDCRKDRRMVNGLFDVKRRGRQKVPKFGG